MLYGLLIGILAGFAAGLLGIGGGFIFVPLTLTLYPGIDVHSAIATSSGFAMVAGMSSFITHWRHSPPLLRLLVPFLCGSVVGAMIGPHIALMLPGPVLARLFAVMVCLPFLMRAVRLSVPATFPVMAFSGLIIGCFSALFGIGGGMLIMPLLTQAFLQDMRRSLTTSALFIAITSTVATASYAWRGVLEWPLLLAAAPTGILAAWVGAKASHRLKPAWLTSLLVIVSGLVILRMLVMP